MTLEILTDDRLAPIRHGFFTRKGGASSGVFDGLNCGKGSSDLAEIVSINRGRVASAMDVAPQALATVHQVHSADVVTVDAPQTGQQKADAMVTSTPGIALGVLTADCQPVLFADPKAGVIGAAHAGWRGALDGVLEQTVTAMEELGAKAANIRAVIGPSISQRAYEVGQDFLERFLDADPDSARFFANGAEGKYQFDLPGYGLCRLQRAGVGEAGWTRHCTYEDPARFYSFRRTTHAGEADYGRLMSVIRL